MAAAPSGAASGPSAGKPPANILFTVTASRATLTAGALALTGVAPVALHTSAGMTAGVVDTGAALLLLQTLEEQQMYKL